MKKCVFVFTLLAAVFFLTSCFALQGSAVNQMATVHTWIDQTFVHRGGLWVDLDMPEPGAFPDGLYRFSLQESREARVENIMPQRMLATEYGVGGEPAFLVRSSGQNDSLMVMCDGQYLGTDGWDYREMDRELFHSLYRTATEWMQQRSFSYHATPYVYRSRLADGTPIVKMLFTRALEGVPMHIGMYTDINATNGDGRSWGYSHPEYVLLMLYEDGRVYYLYQSELSTVVNREPLSAAALSNTEALQQFVSRKAERMMNKHIVVYNMQPCYVKNAVPGSFDAFTAVAGWEISYYICTEGNRDFTESCWHGKVCVNAVTGEVME